MIVRRPAAAIAREGPREVGGIGNADRASHFFDRRGAGQQEILGALHPTLHEVFKWADADQCLKPIREVSGMQLGHARQVTELDVPGHVRVNELLHGEELLCGPGMNPGVLARSRKNGVSSEVRMPFASNQSIAGISRSACSAAKG